MAQDAWASQSDPDLDHFRYFTTLMARDRPINALITDKISFKFIR